ncbi:spore maturation protein cgeB [Paenibacillus sp. CAA11]|uniref:CgeB family protein n=1 Tax=Paenibacillus sp. CAA11 TaxID=1532905 RepID=UPI000D376D55|nr:glycosyltransferase [Paenibacillus sp. CAA11]AWB45813.1 spore maturation protein cgeB [Paenibacillus sp. CAA11]
MYRHRLKKHAAPARKNLPTELEKGREQGYRDGYEEGYLRGRASYIVRKPKPDFPKRQLHVLYVTSGKGYPYSPIDEGIEATLRSLVADVTVTTPVQSVTELVQETRPDMMLVLDGMEMPLETVDSIRSCGVKTAIWLTDDPYYTDRTLEIARHYDYVFTLELNCVNFYRQHGCANVFYLPFGAFTEHYRPTLERSAIRRNISFVGSGYWNRVNFFRPVIGELMNRGLHISGIWWDRLPEASNYPGQVELGKWMEAAETARTYSGSKLVINLHRAHDDEQINNNSLGLEAISPNPRTFEIAASGTLQLVDARTDLSRFYTPGVEIVTFSTQQELLEKVDYYLTHEEERREIALRALERTWSEHTYSHRLNELVSLVME